MPCFNCEDYIELSINSIINQTHTNWELIIIDDASTDNSMSVINRVLKYNTNVRLIQNNMNYGTYYSLNEGLKISKGTFITKLDSDDVYDINKIKYQLEFCISNNIEACTCNIMRGYIYNDRPIYKKEAEDSSLMFSRQIFDNLGYFDNGRFDCDSEYYHRVKQYYTVYNLNKNLYYARYRKDSLTGLDETGTNIQTEGSKIRKKYKEQYRLDNIKYMVHPKYIRNYSVNHIHKCPIEYTFNGNYNIIESTDSYIRFNTDDICTLDIYYKVILNKEQFIYNDDKYNIEFYYLDFSRVKLLSTNKNKISFVPEQRYINIRITFPKDTYDYKPLIIS